MDELDEDELSTFEFSPLTMAGDRPLQGSSSVQDMTRENHVVEKNGNQGTEKRNWQR